MSFFRDIRFNVKYMIEDSILLCKHPSRKATYDDLRRHWQGLWSTIVFHPWYCLKRGISNLYRWFPLVWGSDVYDSCFLTAMTDFKMKEMEDFWKTKADEEREYYFETKETDPVGWRCQHRRIYKRIKWSRKLYAMWIDEHYAMKWYDYHHSKFPDREALAFIDDAQPCEWDEYGIATLFKSASMNDIERDHYRSGSDIANKMDEKTFKLWHKQLKFIRNWWN